MEHIRIKDIVEITGGTLLCGDGNKEIRDFSIDSRQGGEDCIFVPIIGERVDAHRFIQSALERNGATFTQEHDSMEDSKAWIRVQDTVTAMQQVGTYYRDQMKMPVVAVTGSVGKTTTREMISTALASGLKVFQTEGNQNSQIGVPLTLAHMDPEDQAAVLEIGMSERGQIEKLTRMIKPNVAVVTMIGVSHIAQLGSQENICQEKMDIIKGLPQDGKVFLNGDDDFLRRYRGKLPFQTFYYGMSGDCDYRATEIRIQGGKTTFCFHYEGGSLKVTLGTLGDHNVRNALAALGIAHQMGLDLPSAARALAGFSGQRQRLIEGKRCRLIDDTYNASPDSMRAAARVLSSLEDVKGRRIAVLADMLELGSREKEYHFQVGEYIADRNLDEILAFGPLSRELLKGVLQVNPGACVRHFDTREALTEYLLSAVQPEDVVLLKGSNGMKLKEVAEQLQR